MQLNKIEVADALQYVSLIPNKFVDLTVTDIPYGEVNRKSNGLRNLDKDDADVVTFKISDLLDQLVRVTKGSIYIFCGTEQASALRRGMVERGLSTRLCIWEKTNPSPMNGDKIWLSGVECCVFGKFPKAVFNEHCQNTVFRFPCGRNKIHPTQKPIALIEKLILVSSNERDIVLDPFMGSGTTAVAALRNHRYFLGCDKNPKYVEQATGRVKELRSGNIPKFQFDLSCIFE